MTRRLPIWHTFAKKSEDNARAWIASWCNPFRWYASKRFFHRFHVSLMIFFQRRVHCICGEICVHRYPDERGSIFTLWLLLRRRPPRYVEINERLLEKLSRGSDWFLFRYRRYIGTFHLFSNRPEIGLLPRWKTKFSFYTRCRYVGVNFRLDEKE